MRLLICGYTTGVRSSRAIERQCVDDVALRYLAAGAVPDYRSISRFRARHLDALAEIFIQSLHLAQKLGMVRMGRVALDGTKLQANASKHKAMSYSRLVDREERIEAEIAGLEAVAICWLTPRPPMPPRTRRSVRTARTPTWPPSWTGAKSAWPGCRPPARRSRLRPPKRRGDATAGRVQALQNDIIFVRVRRGRSSWPAAERAWRLGARSLRVHLSLSAMSYRWRDLIPERRAGAR